MATIQATKETSPVNVEHRKKLDIRAGDTVRVWTKVVEKGKTRLQAFEGIVLARKHGSEPGATFTVRKVSAGVGIERIFPLYSPNIEKIELVKRAKTRRAKLYYIREKAAKEIRKKMKAATSVIPDFSEPETLAEKEEDKAPEKQPEVQTPQEDSEKQESTASNSPSDEEASSEESSPSEEAPQNEEDAPDEEADADKKE